MRIDRRLNGVKRAGWVLLALAMTVSSLLGCRGGERLGRPGLEVEITIPTEDWKALRTLKGVQQFKEDPHLFLIRFGTGRELRAGYTVRGKTSLKRAFQTKQPERLNYSVELPQAVLFAPAIRLDRLYLMNMIFDPDYFEMRFSYTLLDELGLFPAYNQLVHVAVNGDAVGLNLLIERPKDALLRNRPEISAIYRRSYSEEGFRGLFEPIYRRWPGAGSEHVDRLRSAVATLKGVELTEELDRVLDVESYMRWLAFNSLVRNADSYDEVFFYLVPTRLHPEGRLQVMAWDYDDVMRPTPAHPRLALEDLLLFGAEAKLDRRIQQNPALYQRYGQVLEELLETKLTPDKLRRTLTSVSDELEEIDLGLPDEEKAALLERRRAELEKFEAQLLDRRDELLRYVGQVEKARRTDSPATAPERGARRRTKRAGRESQEAPRVLWRDLYLDAALLSAESGVNFELTAPSEVAPSSQVPIVVRALDAGGRVDQAASGWLRLVTEGSGPPIEREILLRRGVGSTTTSLTDATGRIQLAIDGLTTRREIGITTAEPRELSGPLTGDQLRWRAGDLVHIKGDAAVAAGEKLVVEPGVTVRLGARVNLVVEGDLESHGGPDRPIVFQPLNEAKPWGGIVHGGRGSYRWTFLTGGGGDPQRKYGHSGSQAMVFGQPGSRIVLSHSFLFDAPGKGIGGLGTELELQDCLVSRTDMGGELLDSRVVVSRSWFLDFPDLGAPFRDDDNDALYLRGRFRPAGDRAFSQAPSEITDSVFIGGIDDGIDHYGATVQIRGSWIQGFSHEGVAASVSGNLLVEDTVVTGCEQGVEAGIGSPKVEARHVLIFGNDVGVRYGDAYGARYGGTLEVSDSVVTGNRKHALWNWLHGTRGPGPKGIGLSRSLVDERSWDHGEGNVVGPAVLTPDLRLAPDSAGKGIAAGGADPGLQTPRPAGPSG